MARYYMKTSVTGGVYISCKICDASEICKDRHAARAWFKKHKVNHTASDRDQVGHTVP